MVNSSKNNYPQFQENIPLSKYTTLGIGGPAKYLLEVNDSKKFLEVLRLVSQTRQKHLVISGGSDLLVSDEGFDGLVIVNKIAGIKIVELKIIAEAGTILQELVDTANSKGLAGFENMTGIPGSVGGAVYGNAGAYGQTISDHITQVRFFDGKQVTSLSKNDCNFEYRESIFKRKKGWTILQIEFSLLTGNSKYLAEKSKETINLRLVKYKAGIKCPGSFFKNIIASDLRPKTLKNIQADKIMYGKIPVGFLLETVGAKGDSKGRIKIAGHHGNLFMNLGGGTAKDFLWLAKKYQKRVFDKFGITLEPEVQLIGFKDSI